ncbi:MAG: ThiF family adenylyltransferase [Zavarzinella sp.]
MATIFIAGVGSGGMSVLDLVARDPLVTEIILIDPDFYAPHNVQRHYFPPVDVGMLKVELARRWLQAMRPELSIIAEPIDLLDSNHHDWLADVSNRCDLGICAVDREPAKFQFDFLMRTAHKPWTLGEVLAGGIAGWVHLFLPGSACYGCVCSYLKREIELVQEPVPNYSQQESTLPATSIPASRAAISTMGSLHAHSSLQLLHHQELPFSSLLFPLQVVPEIFTIPYQALSYQFSPLPECLFCSGSSAAPDAENQTMDQLLTSRLQQLGENG